MSLLRFNDDCQGSGISSAHPPTFNCLCSPSCLMISVLCWCRWARCFLSSPQVPAQKTSPGVRAAAVQGTWTRNNLCHAGEGYWEPAHRVSHWRWDISSCSQLSPGNCNSGSLHHGAGAAGNKSVQLWEVILGDGSPAQEFIPFEVWDLILLRFIQQAVTQNGIHLYKATKAHSRSKPGHFFFL